MKKFIRLLLYLLFIFLWVIVIVLSLELFERLRWKYIEKTNKYIRIRRGEILYTEWDPDSKPEVVQYGEGKNIFSPSDLMVGDSFCLPELSDFEKWTYRLAYYLSASEEVKEIMRSVYSLTEFELMVDKSNLTLTSISSRRDSNGHDPIDPASLVIQTDLHKLASGKSITEVVRGRYDKEYLIYFYYRGSEKGDYRYNCFLIPVSPITRWFNPFVEGASVNEIAEIPYFSYFPHVSLTTSAFRTNNYGFRDSDFIVPKPEGVVRVLCIGASTTEEGISNEETYPNFLETILRKYFATDKIEVFNCGISGMTLRKHVAKLPEYILFDPNIVIIYEGVNDVVYDLFPRAFDELGLFPKLVLLFSRFGRAHLRSLPGFAYSLEGILSKLESESLSYLKLLVESFTNSGILVAISSVGVPQREVISSLERDYLDYYYDKEWGWANSTFQQYCEVISMWNEILRDYCEKENLIYVPFAEKIPSSIEYFGDICHLRQKGIKLKAEIMAEVLIPVIEELLKDNKQ